jgi:hypothetical protein
MHLEVTQKNKEENECSKLTTHIVASVQIDVLLHSLRKKLFISFILQKFTTKKFKFIFGNMLMTFRYGVLNIIIVRLRSIFLK